MSQEKDFRWRKIKREDLQSATNMLVDNEENYVSACGRFLARTAGDPVWVLSDKKGEITALAVNSRSSLIPVLGMGKFSASTKKENLMPDFPGNFLRKKMIHSLQGLKNEVVLFEKAMEKTGRKITDKFDYDLMSLDSHPDRNNFKSGPANLVFRVPGLVDLDRITPLQAAYEKEEVIPAGSAFNPAASRASTSNIIANGMILAAELNGRFVGKIHVNAVSFTRYQIGGVYIHPDFRGLGIGRRMTAEFITSLLNESRGVTLFVKKNNMAAQRLYKGLGFTVKGDYRITYY